MKPQKPLKRSCIKRKPPRPVSKERKAARIQRDKDNPFSLYWRDRCEPVWRAICFDRVGNMSQISGNQYNLVVHHLINRDRTMTRWDINNGFVLTAQEHTEAYGNPHGSDAWVFRAMLSRRYPEKAAWVEEHKRDTGRVCWRDVYEELKSIKITQ